MSLKNYRVTFDNNSEWLIESDFKDSDALLDYMTNKSFKLQRGESSPISIRKGYVSMVVEAPDPSISPTEKKWRIVR